MNTIKKNISLLLIFALCLTMFACGDNTHKDKPINSSDDKIKIDTWEDYFGHTVEAIIDLYGNKYS